jgi:hypothetical protein
MATLDMNLDANMAGGNRQRPWGSDCVEFVVLMLTDYAHKVSTSHQIVAPGKRMDDKRNRAATFRTVMMLVFLLVWR